MKKKKISLVTGGGGMLGLQHASALLEIGYVVVLVDINDRSLKKNSFKLKKKYPNKIFFYRTDVSKETEVKTLASKIKKRFNKINVLINNAAIDYVPNRNLKQKNKFLNSFENFSLERWNKELSVGLSGVFLMSKYFGKLMKKMRQML